LDKINSRNKTNNDKSNNNEISRRGFLELGSAAVTGVAGVLAMSGIASAQELVPGVKTGKSTHITDPGPTDNLLDAANPDSNVPPLTDAGGVPAFKYPFSRSNKRMYAGGWLREVTVRELHISKTIAGVDMRLTAGGIRELHWHSAGEWAIMLSGSTRITAVDAEGRSFVRDTQEGDLWYFPTGIPHSIQGLRPDGGEFLLVFDDGNFSEYDTALLSDIVAHTPREVLAKNFGVSSLCYKQYAMKSFSYFRVRYPARLLPTRKRPPEHCLHLPMTSLSEPRNKNRRRERAAERSHRRLDHLQGVDDHRGSNRDGSSRGNARAS
jgi:oxalate decarboxylase